MYLKNGTIQDLQNALTIVNHYYENNIEFNRLEQKGKQVIFTLRVKDSSKPGHRLGYQLTSKGNRRKLASACWHVHGHFFESLFTFNPDCIVTSVIGKITAIEGNWQDIQAGSRMYPVMMSELCDC